MSQRVSTALTRFFFLLQYIDDTLPAESPYLYGLHPNAEIGFLTQTSEKLFRTVLEMQPRDGGVGEGAGTTREEKVKEDECSTDTCITINDQVSQQLF